MQIQALELLRTRRIFTRTSVQAAPKQFLLVAVVAAESGGEARVTAHLNDFFHMAHWHDPDDGFANLDEEEEDGDWNRDKNRDREKKENRHEDRDGFSYGHGYGDEDGDRDDQDARDGQHR